MKAPSLFHSLMYHIVLQSFISLYFQLEYSINQRITLSPLLNESNPIHQMNSSLNQLFTESPNQFLLFHMSYCKHCKKLIPIIKELSGYQIASPFIFIQIECSKNKEACNENSISKYPTIKVKYNNRYIPYEPGADLPNLLEFLLKVQSSPFISVSSEELFLQSYSSYSPVIYAKSNSTVTKCLSESEEAADLAMHYYYGVIYRNDNISDRIHIQLRPGVNQQFKWDINASFSNNCREAIDFLRGYRFAPMRELNANYLNRIKHDRSNCLIFFMTKKQYQSFSEELFQWANKYKNEYVVTYALIGNDNEAFVKSLIDFFQVKEKSNPGVLVYDYSKGKYSFIDGDKANMTELITVIPQLKYKSGDAIEDFFSQFGLKINNRRFRTILLWLIIAGCLLLLFLTFCYKVADEAEVNDAKDGTRAANKTQFSAHEKKNQ